MKNAPKLERQCRSDERGHDRPRDAWPLAAGWLPAGRPAAAALVRAGAGLRMPACAGDRQATGWHGRLAAAAAAAAGVRDLGALGRAARRRCWSLAGAAGLAWLAIEAFAIIHHGWGYAWLTALLGPGPTQPALGWGAVAYALAAQCCWRIGLARQGVCKGDMFVVGSILLVGRRLTALFVFYPVLCMLAVGGARQRRQLRTAAVRRRSCSAHSIWGVGCVTGDGACGAAWNTADVAVLVGLLTTLLGLAFALVAVRTHLPLKPLLRALSILPVITPPFVIGLALILLFGRAGMVTIWLADMFGIPRSRWIYGMPGIAIAQMLAFTPIAFLVLAGVLQGVSPKPGGSGADAARQPLAHLPHRHLAADPAGPRQRVPDRLHREHGRLRQPADDRRQLQRAVDRHLLRRGRRGARPGPRRGAGDRAAGLHADRFLRAAILGRPAQLRDDRPARATAGLHRARCPPALRVAVPSAPSCLAGADRRGLRHHHGRRLRGNHRPRQHASRCEYFLTAFSVETRRRRLVPRPARPGPRSSPRSSRH